MKTSFPFTGNRPTFERQAATIFLIVMVLFCLLTVLRGTPSAGYYSYITGSTYIINGVDPYPAQWKFDPSSRYGKMDFRQMSLWYMYSPSFAVLFYPFTPQVFGLFPGVFLWGLLGVSVFWLGFSGVTRHLDSETKILKKWWYVLALLLLVIDLQPNILVSQANALVVGLIMLALSSYMDEKFVHAAFFLSIGIYIKLFPLVFALLLALEFNRKFIGSLFAFITALFLFPLLFIPSGFYLDIFRHWISMTATLPVRETYLSLQPTLMHYGFDINQKTFGVFMLLNAALIALAALKIFHVSKKNFIKIIFPLGMIFIVLFNKWAERFTFLLAAPVYIFMLHAALVEWRAGNRGLAKLHAASLALAWFLISASYSNLCPKACKDFSWDYRFKTFGAALIYLWAWTRAFSYSGFFRRAPSPMK